MKRDLVFFSLAVCAFVAASAAAEAVAPEGGAGYAQEAESPPAAIGAAVETARAPEAADEPEEVPEEGVDLSYIPLDKPLAETLVESCEALSVPLALALAVMEQESRFQADAVNKESGCYGLFQLNPRYFPQNLTPAENIETGVAYLGELLETYGDEAHALTAYHYGPTEVTESWYSGQVLEKMETWEN